MDSKRSFKLANTKEARAYIILGVSLGMINQRYVRMMLFEVRCIAVDFSAIEIGYKCGNLFSVLKDREA